MLQSSEGLRNELSPPSWQETKMYCPYTFVKFSMDHTDKSVCKQFMVVHNTVYCAVAKNSLFWSGTTTTETSRDIKIITSSSSKIPGGRVGLVRMKLKMEV